jgi:hypothetical protein
VELSYSKGLSVKGGAAFGGGAAWGGSISQEVKPEIKWPLIHKMATLLLYQGWRKE